VKTPFHSLRWRIQAWYAALLFLVVVGFCATAYQLARVHQFRRADRELFRMERVFIRSLVREFEAASGQDAHRVFAPQELLERLRRGGAGVPAELAATFASRQAGYFYFAFCDRDGRVLLQSANFPEEADLPAPREVAEPWEDVRTVGTRRESVRIFPEGLVAVFGMDLSADVEELTRFAWSLSGIAACVLAAALAGGWWLAGRALRPIREISRTAVRIADGQLEERINLAGRHSELTELARVLDDTFARLHAAFEQQRRFTADASHELRTPITILLSETQRMLKRPRSAEEYRAAIETCHEAALRMRRLVEALLELAWQESGGATRRTVCDLAAVAAEAITTLRGMAAERNVTIAAKLEGASLRGDPASLGILVANLLRNAIEHSPSGGRVEVACGADGSAVWLQVRDHGPGIAPEDRPHLFERFYRSDRARSGGGGNVGLGLAIAQTIARNHGGGLEVESEPGRGAVFTFRVSCWDEHGGAEPV